MNLGLGNYVKRKTFGMAKPLQKSQLINLLESFSGTFEDLESIKEERPGLKKANKFYQTLE